MTDRDGMWSRGPGQDAIEELADNLPGHPPLAREQVLVEG